FIHTRAFAAGMELEALVVDEGRAMIEAIFAGVHTGEFGGLAPTGRAVRVQYAVAFDLAGDAITALRVYLPLEALARQVRHG
ncbi:MAG: ester cyclase, partial [Dehalococcoidia bacterium]